MILLSILAGGIVGAIVLSLITLLFHWLFFRRMLGDGQYTLVFFGTVPVGAVLGAITGAVMAYCAAGQLDTAGRIARIGGGVPTVLFLLLGLCVSGGTEKPKLWDRLTGFLFWFGAPLLWAVLLLITGFRL